MEKKMYVAPEMSVMKLNDSLCETYAMGSEIATKMFSKDQDFEDDNYEDSPWEE